MAYKKFDVAKLERLNDPGRLESIPPNRLWEAVGAPAESRDIVEIGAGTGLFATAFLKLAPAATVYATDVEQPMLDWMRANHSEVEEGRLVVVESAEASVPLPDASADLVYMINLHHELADPEAIYAESFRLLRPLGRILVADWAPIDTPKGPPMAVRVSAEDLGAFLTAAGFEDVQVHDGALQWHSLVTGVRPAAR